MSVVPSENALSLAEILTRTGKSYSRIFYRRRRRSQNSRLKGGVFLIHFLCVGASPWPGFAVPAVQLRRLRRRVRRGRRALPGNDLLLATVASSGARLSVAVAYADPLWSVARRLLRSPVMAKILSGAQLDRANAQLQGRWPARPPVSDPYS